jgi:uncharacterized protein
MTPLETVKSFYDALGRGDAPAALGLLAEPLTWTEAEGFPYYSGTWTTPQQVFDNLLVPLNRDWDGFAVRPESFLTGGFEIAAFGTYTGVAKATGRKLAAPFAHRWKVVQGKLSSFYQYTDTVLVAYALSVP